MNCVLFITQIEKSNEKGTEVLRPVDKGKEAVQPMPEVVLPPTAEQQTPAAEPKLPTVGDDVQMEEPPQQQAPQLRPLP
jgi:hypothetical protein